MTYTYTKTGLKRTESNGSHTATFTYDELGRLIKETETGIIEKRYTYDLAGNRLSFILLHSGYQKSNTSYEYDKLGRLYKVYENSILSATYTYDANGNRLRLTYGNGVVTTYEYNNANFVTLLTNYSGSSQISQYSYTYYLDGNQATKVSSNEKIQPATNTITLED